MDKQKEVERFLQEKSPLSLQFKWHENKSSYLSFKKENKSIDLRLHKLFLTAPTPVLEALVSFIVKRDKKSQITVRKMAHLYFSENAKKEELFWEGGIHFDLKAIYLKVKEQFFLPDFEVAVGWSKAPQKTSFRHMTFGTYDRYFQKVLIHPFLDHPEVPLFFVEFIVYHEMLHAVCLPTIDSRGHIHPHTKEFREKEKLFPDYKKAKEWEKNSLKFFKSRMGRYGRA